MTLLQLVYEEAIVDLDDDDYDEVDKIIDGMDPKHEMLCLEFVPPARIVHYSGNIIEVIATLQRVALFGGSTIRESNSKSV